MRLHEPTERGFTTAGVDPCIAPIVQALNDAGVQTVASCCGHGQRAGNIALRDGRELIIARDFDEARLFDDDGAGQPAPVPRSGPGFEEAVERGAIALSKSMYRGRKPGPSMRYHMQNALDAVLRSPR